MNKTAALAQSTCSHLGRAQPNLSGPPCASLAALHTVSTGCSVLPFPNHLDLPVEMPCLLTWKRCFLELDFKKQDAWCNHLSTILSACMKPHSSRYLLSDSSTKVICNPNWAITLLTIDWYSTWLGHLILLTLSFPFILMLVLNMSIFGHTAAEICGLFSNIFWYWFLT